MRRISGERMRRLAAWGGLAAALATVAAVVVLRPAPAPPALAAPSAFTGPVNGGCYTITLTTCALHVDAWQPIGIDPGHTLDGFQLALVGSNQTSMTLYDFHSDVSNPPGNNYRPSLVRKDFPAQCGGSYYVALNVWQSDASSYVEAGRTNEFQCPAALATATPTPTSTPTVTPMPTATATLAITPTATTTAMPTGTVEPPGESAYLPITLDMP